MVYQKSLGQIGLMSSISFLFTKPLVATQLVKIISNLQMQLKGIYVSIRSNIMPTHYFW